MEYKCVNHELIIAKLAAYGLKIDISKRKQLLKIGSSLSVWLDIFLGVPQGSILKPILLGSMFQHSY